MNRELHPKIPFPPAGPVLRDDQGSALVEQAIVLILLLTILFGIMDFARFLYTYHFVSEAAREGTRYAVVRGATFGTTACAQSPYVTYGCSAIASDVQAYVENLTPQGINSSSLSVTPTWPGSAPAGAATGCAATGGTHSLRNVPGCLVQVAVSYPFHFMLPFVPRAASTWTVTSTSSMVIQQ